MKTLLHLCIFVFLSVFTYFPSSFAASWPLLYDVVDLGMTDVYDINNHLQVTGFNYVWDNGKLIEVTGYNNGINDNGDVVGHSQRGQYSPFQPYLWNRENGRTELCDLDLCGLSLREVNNQGIVAATGDFRSSTSYWQQGNELVYAPDKSAHETVADISSSSQPMYITGMKLRSDEVLSAFLWTVDNEGLSTINYIQSDRFKHSFALGVNDVGQVVGSLRDGGRSSYLYSAPREWSDYHNINSSKQGFLWDQENGLRELGSFASDDPFNQPSLARAINNAGHITGWAMGDATERRAFIYSETNGLVDLNDLIPEDSGWVLDEGININDADHIVGNGRFNGEDRAFILIPKDSVELADLTVSMVSNSTPPHRNEHFEIQVSINNLLTAFTLADLTLSYSEGVTIVNAPNNCQSNVTFTACEKIPVDGSATISFTVSYSYIGSLQFDARVESSVIDVNRSNDSNTLELVTLRSDPLVSNPLFYYKWIHTFDKDETIFDAKINELGWVILHTEKAGEKTSYLFNAHGKIQSESPELIRDANRLGALLNNNLLDGLTTINPVNGETLTIKEQNATIYGTAINNHGVILGQYQGSNEYEQVFVYDGELVRINDFGAGSIGQDINDENTVIGMTSRAINSSHIDAFIYKDNQFNVLEAVTGGSSYAYGINNFDTIAGAVEDSQDVLRPALYKDEQWFNLFTEEDNRIGVARAINDKEWVVGYRGNDSSEKLAFIYYNQQAFDLNTRLLMSLSQFWSKPKIIDAFDLNNSGQIVALTSNENNQRTLMVLSPYTIPRLTAQLTTITPADVRDNLYFGQAVDFNEHWLAVGAPGAPETHVYNFNQNQWMANTIFDDSIDSRYGKHVQFDNNILAVAGKNVIDLYHRSIGAWRLLANQGSALNNIQMSTLLFDQNTLVYASVGSEFRILNVLPLGEIDIANERTLDPQSYEPSTASYGSAFGRSIALSHDELLIGGRNKVYVFKKTGDSHFQLHKTIADAESTNYHQFGIKIAATQSRMIIVDIEITGWTDKLYIYDRIEGEWVLSNTIEPCSRCKGFGFNIALTDEYLAMSSFLMGDNKLVIPQLHLYQLDGNQWTEQLRLQPTNQQFETSDVKLGLALDKQRLAFGVDAVSVDGFNNVGSVYLYDIEKAQRLDDSTDIALSITQFSEIIYPADTVEFVVTARNLHTAKPAFNLTININIPEAAELVSYPDLCSLENAILSCSYASIEGGAEVSFAFHAKINQASNISFSATAATDEFDINLNNNSSLLTIEIAEPMVKLDSTINGMNIKYGNDQIPVAVSIDHWPLSDGRHYRWYLNGVERGVSTNVAPIELSDLNPNTYKLNVRLFDAEDNFIGVEHTIDFSVFHETDLQLEASIDEATGWLGEPFNLILTLSDQNNILAPASEVINISIPHYLEIKSLPEFCEKTTSTMINCNSAIRWPQAQYEYSIALVSHSKGDSTISATIETSFTDTDHSNNVISLNYTTVNPIIHIEVADEVIINELRHKTASFALEYFDIPDDGFVRWYLGDVELGQFTQPDALKLEGLQEGTNTLTLKLFDSDGNYTGFEKSVNIKGKVATNVSSPSVIITSPTGDSPLNQQSEIVIRFRIDHWTNEAGNILYRITANEHDYGVFDQIQAWSLPDKKIGDHRVTITLVHEDGSNSIFADSVEFSIIQATIEPAESTTKKSGSVSLLFIFVFSLTVLLIRYRRRLLELCGGRSCK